MSLYSKKGKGLAFGRRGKKQDDGDEQKDGAGTQTVGQIRVQKDLADLELPPNVKLIREENEWMKFSLIIHPTTGLWKGAMYEFAFVIPPKYPFDGPSVTCIDKIYHPNIDLKGGICVNILRPW
eukprot:CAMPEP_0175113972 /NCGR_PEP_ID=MMETSP0086_2-20121207/16527_1 /TAXON_ID=136419 /ORGANISM="Unknown Unknown, Strain D1" /LENGTH=123 /DNA_ID=CAMNT_0016393429 /DNA_START=645 /DNA_END=1013 /DNA_ORIENTATION=+